MAVAHTRTSATQNTDMATQWRLKCQVLEERLEDATRALKASEAARLELSADYRHALNALWKANAGMARRER